MAKRLKRAFTIVELVIVIAVIAILAAVLIPTFTTLIDKANQSNDTVTVKNLNTAITATEATEEINTMQDALDAAQGYGYTVDKLTPTSSGDIVWDEVSKRFALLDSDGKVVYAAGELSSGASLWKIAKDGELSTKYSNYLSGEWSGPIETSLGVDVGSNEGLDIQYTNTSAQTVTFRTNGGTLTIKAPNDTVNHYGTAVKVVITEVKDSSYHLYGEVLGNIELTKGRVVVEEGASASTILVKAGSAADIKIEVNSNATVGTVAATAAGVITAENTTVPSTTDKVTEAVTANSDFAGGIGTEKSPYLIETAEQLMNIGLFYDQMSKAEYGYWKIIADINLEGVNTLTGQSYITYGFCGVLDGDNHTITASKKSMMLAPEAIVGATVKNITIVQQGENEEGSGLFSIFTYAGWADALASGYKKTGGTYVFENITIKGATEKTLVKMGTNSSVFLSQTNSGVIVKFIDCTNELNIDTGTGYAGIFLGGYTYGNTQFVFKNCSNKAIITGNAVGFFTGNTNAASFVLAEKEDFSDVAEPSSNIAYAYVENCKNEGTMIGILACGAFARGSTSFNPTFNQAANNSLEGLFTAGIMTEGNQTTDLALEKTEKNGKTYLTIVPTKMNSAVGAYEFSMRVSTSYYKKNGERAGTSYIEVVVPAVAGEDVNGWTTEYVTKIILSTKYQELTGVSYAEIEGTEKTDNRNHAYKIAEQDDGTFWVVVSYESLMAEADGLVVGEGGYMELGGTSGQAVPTYTLLALNELGQTFGKVSYTSIS